MTTLRRFLLFVFVLGVAGTATELLLLGHTEKELQFVPLALFGLSLVLVVVLVIYPRAWGIRLFRGVMVLFVVSGLVGLYLHITANVEFELEIYPSMSGIELVWESLRGAIPALAPGTMIYLGLVGLASTFRHPLLEENS